MTVNPSISFYFHFPFHFSISIVASLFHFSVSKLILSSIHHAINISFHRSTIHFSASLHLHPALRLFITPPLYPSFLYLSISLFSQSTNLFLHPFITIVLFSLNFLSLFLFILNILSVHLFFSISHHYCSYTFHFPLSLFNLSISPHCIPSFLSHQHPIPGFYDITFSIHPFLQSSQPLASSLSSLPLSSSIHVHLSNYSFLPFIFP